MSQETEMLKLLLEGQKEISEQIRRVHKRLDTISERSLVNEQSIIHLGKSFEDEKCETKDKFDIVHKSIRRRDNHLKWIAASILMPIILSVFAFFKPLIK